MTYAAFCQSERGQTPQWRCWCLPLASPMQYTLETGLPLLSRTSICSLTGTKPRLSVSAPMAARFKPCKPTQSSSARCAHPVRNALMLLDRGPRITRLQGQAWRVMQQSLHRSTKAVLGPTCVYGARPVATSTASTSSSSTFSLVLKSVSSTMTGFTPGTPAQPMNSHSQIPS